MNNNTLSIVLIITCCFSLSSALDLQIMQLWSLDNCRDQLNAYSNLMTNFNYDQLLFECAEYSPYQKTVCEDEAKLDKKHDIIKNFYNDCVVGYVKYQKESIGTQKGEPFLQDFCKYFNKTKSDYEQQQQQKQQYIDYVQYQDQDFIDCKIYEAQICKQMNDIEYKACIDSVQRCCEEDQMVSLFYDSKVYYYFYYILFYLKRLIILPLVLLLTIFWFKN